MKAEAITDINAVEPLEALVDRHGLGAVLMTLADIAEEKATHIETNWQDRQLAGCWRHNAKAIENVADKLA